MMDVDGEQTMHPRREGTQGGTLCMHPSRSRGFVDPWLLVGVCILAYVCTQLALPHLKSYFAGQDAEAFAAAEQTNSIRAYRSYLNGYPNGIGAQRAIAALESLAFAEATDSHTIDAYREYLHNFPSGAHAEMAIAALESLAFAGALDKHTVDAFREYLRDFPSGEHAEMAEAAIEDLSFEGARQENSIKAYESFIAEHPRSRYRRKAKDLLETAHFDQVRSKGTIQAVNRYLEAYPRGRHAPAAKELLGDYALRDALQASREKWADETARRLSLLKKYRPRAIHDFYRECRHPPIYVSNDSGIEGLLEKAGFLPVKKKPGFAVYECLSSTRTEQGRRSSYSSFGVGSGSEYRHGVKAWAKMTIKDFNGRDVFTLSGYHMEEAPSSLTVWTRNGVPVSSSPSQGDIRSDAVSKARASMERDLKRALKRHFPGIQP